MVLNDFQNGNGVLGVTTGRIGFPNIGFKFITELVDRILDGPGCSIGQSTDRGAWHDSNGISNFEQQVQIMQAAFPGPNSFHHAEGPGGSLAARGALATTLVGEKLAAVVQEIDHRDRLVHDDYRGSPQAQAVVCAWTRKVERTVKFIGPQQAHADPARNSSLGLALSRNAPAMFFDQLVDGDPQGSFVTTRTFDVAAKTI